jgi:hypothetical protein
LEIGDLRSRAWISSLHPVDLVLVAKLVEKQALEDLPCAYHHIHYEQGCMQDRNIGVVLYISHDVKGREIEPPAVDEIPIASNNWDIEDKEKVGSIGKQQKANCSNRMNHEFREKAAVEFVARNSRIVTTSGKVFQA